MELQSFNNNDFLYQPQEVYLQAFDDMLAFEDAFEGDSLRGFFQAKPQLQPLEVPSYNFDFMSSAKDNDMLCDEMLSQSDDRETQASPLIQYANRYSQEPSVTSGFARKLDYQFFTETESSSEAQSECRSPCQVLSETVQIKQLFAQPVEGTQVFEMKGNLSINFTFKAKTQNKLQISRSTSQCSEFSNMSEFSRLKSKKIFKIEKTKPRLPIKEKASLNVEKSPSSPSIKIIKGANTTITLSKNGFTSFPKNSGQEKKTLQFADVSFANLICHETRLEQGLSIQKIEGRILKL